MTRQQLATRESGAVQPRPQGQHNGGLLPTLTPKAVKDFLCQKATNEEVAVFVHLCRSLQLNPFQGDAYIIKLDGTDKRTGKPHPAYYVIHFRKRIEPCTKHPTFERYEYGLILMVNGKPEERVGEFSLPNEKIVGAWVKIWKKNQKEPFLHRIPYDPWVKTYPGSNDPIGMWKTNPAHMICKTAVTQGFSYLYPGLTLANLPEDGEISSVTIRSEEPSDSPKSLSAGAQPVDDDGPGEGEIIDEGDGEDWSGIEASIDEHDDEPGAPEKEEPPTTEEARQAALVKRQRHFHLFMRKKGYKTDVEIKKRLSDVLGEPVTSLKAFIADDEKFVAWADKENYYSEDPEGELFGAD